MQQSCCPVRRVAGAGSAASVCQRAVRVGHAAGTDEADTGEVEFAADP